MCYGVLSNNSKQGWFVDSAATCHMCSDEDFFTELDKSKNENVYLADGSLIKAKGIGEGFLNLKDNKILVKNVLFVPELDGNLLSVRKLVLEGFKITFNENKCFISSENNVYAIATLRNNLFEIDQFNTAKMVSSLTKGCVHLWHNRFGHRDINVIKSGINKSLINGVSLTNCACSNICDICLKGKMSRKPFPKASLNRSEEILDLIHSDLCGPIQNPSPSGSRYFLTLIDDKIRYCTVYFLKT